MNDEQLPNAALPACRNPERRLRWLIAALAASCAVPLLSSLVPSDVAWMPLEGLLESPPIGVMLALSFWIGLGNAPLVVRLFSGAVGAVYIIAAAVIVEWLQWLLVDVEFSLRSELVALTCIVGIAVTLVGGIFTTLRGWWALQPTCEPDRLTAPKAQFSILYILLLTAATALVLTLIRLSRGSLTPSDDSLLAMNILCIVVFASNAVCASFAALRPAPVGRSCGLVLLIAYASGGALSFGASYDRDGWVMIALSSFIGVLPTAILLGSLLVVRSTGYRLLRKSAVS